MSEQGGVLPGLWPIHGDGVLARYGDLVLLVHPAGGPFTDRLLDLVASAARAGENGRRFADLISAAYESDAAAAPAAGDDQGPAAVAFGPVGNGTAVAVYGTAWAEITTARGIQHLATGEPYGRLLCVLPSAVVMVRAGVRPAGSVGDTDPYLRLAEGVVRAVALVYAPAELPPGTERPASHAVPTAEAETPAAEEPSAVVEAAAALVPDVGQAQAADQAQDADQAWAAGQAQAAEQEQDADQAWAAEQEQDADQAWAAGQVQDADQAWAAGQVQDADQAWVADQAGPVADVPGPARLDVAEQDQAPPPGPALPDAGFGRQEAVHVPTSLDVGWRDQAPQEQSQWAPGFGDQGAVHVPTSLDVAWRDQTPQEQGQWAAGPGGQGVPGQADSDFGRDFVAVSFLEGMPPGDMPRRDPLPLGAEPVDDSSLGIVEGPAPIVTGIYCKSSHFNDPEARFCAVCGIGMAQLTKVPQEGRRPPLGVLVLDDGSVCQLDADYVIGREPTLDKSVADGRARPLRLGGASDLVSRIHARVELDGWQVFVCDLNSANGTQLVLPGETTGTMLAPGVRTPLVAGAKIRLGDAYALQYDSHRHR